MFRRSGAFAACLVAVVLAQGVARGQMMDPRDPRMHGVTRVDNSGKAPPSSFVVRVVRGAMANNVVGTPVNLVGYHADGRVVTTTEVTDREGRAIFRKLPSMNVNYYVSAVIERPNGQYDRVMAGPLEASARHAQALLLSGELPESTNAMDDLIAQHPGRQAPRNQRVIGIPEGTVIVYPSIDVQVSDDLEIELADVATGTAIAAARIKPARMISFMGGMQAAPLQVGELKAVVWDRDVGEPVSGIHIELHDLQTPAASPTAEPFPRRAVSTIEGVAFTGLAPGRYRLLAHAGDDDVIAYSSDIDVSAEPSDEIQVFVSNSVGRAEFRGLPRLGKVVAARLAFHGRTNYSVPFELLPNQGAEVMLWAHRNPVKLDRFFASGQQDDDTYFFHVQLRIRNESAMPIARPEGFVFPLPRGALRVTPDESISDHAKSAPGRAGLLWHDAIPAFGQTIEGSFSMQISDGEFAIDWDFPDGAQSSQLVLRTPNTAVLEPLGPGGAAARAEPVYHNKANAEECESYRAHVEQLARGSGAVDLLLGAPAVRASKSWNDWCMRRLDRSTAQCAMAQDTLDGARRCIQRGNGTVDVVYSQVSIPEGRSLKLRVSNLPEHPRWHRWVTYSLGVLVIGGLGFALFLCLSGRRADDPSEAVIGRLAELELMREKGGLSQAKYHKRKQRLVAEYVALRGSTSGIDAAATEQD